LAPAVAGVAEAELEVVVDPAVPALPAVLALLVGLADLVADLVVDLARLLPLA